MGRLDDKVAVVTGAGSGIGRAIAIRFAKEGAKVVASTLNPEHGAETIEAIEAGGGTAIFVQANNRNRDDVVSIINKAKEAWGKLDILVNAAGVLVHKPFLEHTDEDYDLISETNFKPYVWAMQTAIPLMQADGGGSIVNIASISASKPELNAYYYGAFKAAIQNISINVAKEFARDHIRVNVICPGPVLTAMTPKEALRDPEMMKFFNENIAILGRMGEPDDIANDALFLASDEASWITGTTHVVDGGVSISG